MQFDVENQYYTINSANIALKSDAMGITDYQNNNGNPPYNTNPNGNPTANSVLNCINCRQLAVEVSHGVRYNVKSNGR